MTQSQTLTIVETSADELRQSRRDRWAPTLARALTLLHFLAIWLLFNWYYYVAPQWKHDLESLKRELSKPVRLLIGQSDAYVNYWYILVPFAPLFIWLDVKLLRSFAQEQGMKRATILGLLIALIVLLYILYCELACYGESKWQALQIAVPVLGPIP